MIFFSFMNLQWDQFFPQHQAYHGCQEHPTEDIQALTGDTLLWICKDTTPPSRNDGLVLTLAPRLPEGPVAPSSPVGPLLPSSPWGPGAPWGPELPWRMQTGRMKASIHGQCVYESSPSVLWNYESQPLTGYELTGSPLGPPSPFTPWAPGSP